jgi:hypothetical protein
MNEIAESRYDLRGVSDRLAAELLASPRRVEIKTAIETLDSASGPSRGQVGYAGRKQRAQFYGYLLVDENRSEFPGVQLEALSSMDRRVLTRGHAAISYLNGACLSAVEGLPVATHDILSPYARLKRLGAPVAPAPTLFGEEIAAAAASAFASSTPAETVRATPDAIRSRLPPEAMAEMVRRLQDDAATVGPMAAPEDILPLVRRQKPGSAEYHATRYWFALTSLAEMLRTLDQRLFQAIVHDSAPALTDEGVLSVSGPASHAMGHGYTIDCIPMTNEMLRVAPGDIVRVELEKIHACDDAVVCATDLSGGSDLGFRLALSLRTVDDDLNPYSGLLR